MARSSHDPLWKAALAAATRNAGPIRGTLPIYRSEPEAREAADSTDPEAMEAWVRRNKIFEAMRQYIKLNRTNDPDYADLQRMFEEESPAADRVGPPTLAGLEEEITASPASPASPAKPAKPAKPDPKDEGEKPDVSDDCDTCDMPLEFCHCKDMAGTRANVEDDVLITESSMPGLPEVADLDYPNEYDEGK